MAGAVQRITMHCSAEEDVGYDDYGELRDDRVTIYFWLIDHQRHCQARPRSPTIQDTPEDSVAPTYSLPNLGNEPNQIFQVIKVVVFSLDSGLLLLRPFYMLVSNNILEWI